MIRTEKQVFTDFIETPKEYVLINPTDESIEFGYGGETRIVPPYNKAVLPHPKFSDVPHSAIDENGNYIPGTLLVKDLFGPLSEALGGSERVWNAADAIKHTLGIDVKTGAASGAYAQRGLSVGPRVYTLAVINRLKESGRGRYEIWRLKEAEDTIAAHDSKNAQRERLGMPTVPGDENYRKSVLLLKMANVRQEKELNASIDISFSEEAAQKQGPATSPLTDGVSLLSDEDKKKLLDALMQEKSIKNDPDYYIKTLDTAKGGTDRPTGKDARKRKEATV